MNVLVIGGGGREHALVRKIRHDDPKAVIYAIPGNPGMARDSFCRQLPQTDLAGLVEFAKRQAIDLTFVGGEECLSRGIVDLFQAAGCPIFGPTKAASQIETSKLFAKELMMKYHVPTAAYQSFTKCDEAFDYVDSLSPPIVIKADGLAAGKGVVIALNIDDAKAACQDLLNKHRAIVIEEYLEGIEFSLMALVHGRQVVPLAIAQDYKRVGEQNKGPNTGGMGAYSPVPQIPASIVRKAVNSIMIPVAEALVNENIPFTGVLYGGLMWTESGVKVIEFNARFGDPETEVVLPRMQTKLIVAIQKLLANKPFRCRFSRDATVGVVLASKGYPGKSELGKPIDIPLEDPQVLHMGTQWIDSKLCNAGGRVAIAIGKKPSLAQARDEAYQKVASITNEVLFFRSDIAKL